MRSTVFFLAVFPLWLVLYPTVTTAQHLPPSVA
jgi:hypothetical protein